MIRYVIISGKPRAGKTTFGDKVIEELHNNNRVAYQTSSVNRIKNFAYDMGWDGVKTPEARKFLSDLKQVCVNSPWGNLTMQYIIREAKAVESGIHLYADPSFPLYVLVQSREPSEIQEYVQTLGATAVFVRGGHREENVNSNESDRNVANFSYHYYIDNTGNLADLDIEVSKFMKWLLDNE